MSLLSLGRSWPRHPRALRALALPSLLLLSPACHDDPSCEDHVETVQSCNRQFTSFPCADARGVCEVACFAKLPCDEYPAVDNGDYPAWLSRCLAKCVETFTCGDGARIDVTWQCDGAADCADGSDEGERCEYHRCTNGQPVRSSAKCDGYVHCGDASDEEGCP